VRHFTATSSRVARPGVRTQRRPNVRSSPSGLIAGTTVWDKSEIGPREPTVGGRPWRWPKAAAGGRMLTHGDAKMRRGVASLAQKCVGASHRPDAAPAPAPRPAPPAPRGVAGSPPGQAAGRWHRFPRSMDLPNPRLRRNG
jgi:hypothetical protein